MMDDFAMMTSDIPEKFRHGKELMENIEEKIFSRKGESSQINYAEIRQIIINSYKLKIDLQTNKQSRLKVKNQFQSLHNEIKEIVTDIFCENAKIGLLEPDDRSFFASNKGSLPNPREVGKFIDKILNENIRDGFFDKNIKILRFRAAGAEMNETFIKSGFQSYIGMLAEKCFEKNMLMKKSLHGMISSIDGNDVANQVADMIDKDVFYRGKEKDIAADSHRRKEIASCTPISRDLVELYANNAFENTIIEGRLSSAHEKLKGR
jgi:hypothetical protein